MKESFTDDGFFKTGDVVTKDKDGYFIILGRTENLYFSCIIMLQNLSSSDDIVELDLSIFPIVILSSE